MHARPDLAARPPVSRYTFSLYITLYIAGYYAPPPLSFAVVGRRRSPPSFALRTVAVKPISRSLSNGGRRAATRRSRIFIFEFLASPPVLIMRHGASLHSLTLESPYFALGIPPSYTADRCRFADFSCRPILHFHRFPANNTSAFRYKVLV